MFKFVSTKVGFGETRTLKQRSWESYNFARHLLGENYIWSEMAERKERKKESDWINKEFKCPNGIFRLRNRD